MNPVIRTGTERSLSNFQWQSTAVCMSGKNLPITHSVFTLL